MKSYFKLALKVLARRKFFTFISLFGISMTLVVLMVAVAFVVLVIFAAFVMFNDISKLQVFSKLKP